jgi:hypothetical protein
MMRNASSNIRGFLELAKFLVPEAAVSRRIGQHIPYLSRSHYRRFGYVIRAQYDGDAVEMT